MSATVISAIVVNYRRPDILGKCLSSLRVALERVDEGSELIVVDNASGDESSELVRGTAPDAMLIEMSENRGFPTAASEGIRHSSGEWVLLINNDVEVEPDAVEQLLAAVESPDVGS